MTAINHHISDDLLAAYAAGTLPHPYAVVVAAHISLCLDCRAGFEAHQMAGGALLEAANSEAVSGNLKSSTLALLDAPAPVEKTYARSGVYPGPVMEALKGKPPRWKSLGLGVRQCILSGDREGSVRLLYIPPGQAVPDHSHNGLELTLVLQGSFSDETGRFGVGDLEIADQDLEHTPIADAGPPCICLAATDAPLRFNALLPRLLQPLFKI
ncbi:ChrR family anti-sigma-E factor [Sulfitobacter mediterraneus]|uniref:Transcriptional regulator n=1 Tax=Sulfitobacter mediterraneus TaxID=83219 RepID=A0A061SWP9_9RHOB|nr:ChrR family anti-sigma-E factor [Sulfitobacter mediterraneus]KAJ04299.1 transcriptional regulator [Sulfitobacter mediterraneus]